MNVGFVCQSTVCVDAGEMAPCAGVPTTLGVMSKVSMANVALRVWSLATSENVTSGTAPRDLASATTSAMW